MKKRQVNARDFFSSFFFRFILVLSYFSVPYCYLNGSLFIMYVSDEQRKLSFPSSVISSIFVCARFLFLSL